MFVQIWCQNFCGQNFFLANQKFLSGGYFYVSPKMTLEFFPNCGCGTKIWKCQNVMKHPDMQKFLTYEHSLLTILGPKVLAEPNLAAILTQLHLLPRTQIFTEASYFVLVYLCLIWCWYLEWCRSHRASKLAFCSMLGLINLWKPFLPTSNQNTMGVSLAKLTPSMSSIQIWCNLGGGYFYICPNLVSEFLWPKFFFGQPEILEGGSFTFLQKWPWNFFPTVGESTKIWKHQNVMKHPDMKKILTYKHSLLTILGPKVLAEPNLAAILTHLQWLSRVLIFTEASYFVLLYLCQIWCRNLECFRSHWAPKLAFYSILGLLNLWQPFWPTSNENIR